MLFLLHLTISAKKRFNIGSIKVTKEQTLTINNCKISHDLSFYLEVIAIKSRRFMINLM